jgi:hypothetical protein
MRAHGEIGAGVHRQRLQQLRQPSLERRSERNQRQRCHTSVLQGNKCSHGARFSVQTASEGSTPYRNVDGSVDAETEAC